MSKIDELIQIISSTRKDAKILLPKEITLFFLGSNKRECIRIYRGCVSAIKSLGPKHIFFLSLGRISREIILERFAKLEFIIDEFIRVIIIGQDYEKSILFDDLFLRMNFRKKVEVLSNNKYLLKRTEKLLIKIAEFRNDMAHKWGLHEVKYKGKFLDDRNVESEFRKDFNSTVNDILEAYLEIQKKINIERLIELIEAS